MAPPPGFQTGPSVADLERRLAAIEKVFTVGNDGTVTIRANTQLKLLAGAVLDIKAGATVTVDGPAGVTLKGGIVKLGNGSKPVFRTGDIVVNGMATMGNPTVLA